MANTNVSIHKLFVLQMLDDAIKTAKVNKESYGRLNVVRKYLINLWIDNRKVKQYNPLRDDKSNTVYQVSDTKTDMISAVLRSYGVRPSYVSPYKATKLGYQILLDLIKETDIKEIVYLTDEYKRIFDNCDNKPLLVRYGNKLALYVKPDIEN